MFKKTIETSDAPQLIVNDCSGDLTVRGAEEAEIEIRVPDEAALTLQQEGEGWIINTHSDCRLTCPIGATLTINAVHGDLNVKSVTGDINIKDVYGDARLKNTGPLILAQVYGDVTLRAVDKTTVGQVFGDLQARHVAGDLQAQSITGDVAAHGVEGRLTLQHVASDLRAEGILGGLEAAQVGADIRLAPPFIPDMAYVVQAGSDIVIELDEDARVQMALQAGASILSRVPDLVPDEGEGEGDTDSPRIATYTIGEDVDADQPMATLEAKAGASIVLVSQGDMDFDVGFPGEFDIDMDFLNNLEGLGEMIEARIGEAMAEMETHLERGLSHIDAEKIREHVERATHVAERAAERARRTAEREAQKARFRAERAERRWQRASGHRPPQPPHAPHAPAEPQPPQPDVDQAKHEEKLKVLQMVEDGKLSPSEAAELLAALR
jgi:hypothetical protein